LRRGPILLLLCTASVNLMMSGAGYCKRLNMPAMSSWFRLQSCSEPMVGPSVEYISPRGELWSDMWRRELQKHQVRQNGAHIDNLPRRTILERWVQSSSWHAASDGVGLAEVSSAQGKTDDSFWNACLAREERVLDGAECRP
jgi:hypothetical protein